MKLYVNNPTSLPNALARVVLDATGQTAELVIADEEFRKTPGYKALTTTDKFPLLQTAEGTLHESTAIAKYFCTLAGGKFLGSTPVERSQVDQWIAWNNTTLFPQAYLYVAGIFGWEALNQQQSVDGLKNIKAHVKTLNTALEGKEYIVGNQLSVADFVLALTLSYLFQTTLDAGFRKAMGNVTTWAERIYAHESFVRINGRVLMCAKALKPVIKEEPKKVENKAAPVAAPKPAEKKEDKVKDNVESLPPTSFDLYNFKTFYVNHEDKKGAAIDEMYKILDWEGWAFWHLFYEKYTGEGEKLHVTNNMLGGFMNRAEHTSKYTFGRIGVFGEEPNLEIVGVWLMRGTELPDGLVKEHAQFEYYKTRKLDPRNNKDDDALIRAYFGGAEEEIIEGRRCQSLKWQK